MLKEKPNSICVNLFEILLCKTWSRTQIKPHFGTCGLTRVAVVINAVYLWPQRLSPASSHCNCCRIHLKVRPFFETTRCGELMSARCPLKLQFPLCCFVKNPPLFLEYGISWTVTEGSHIPTQDTLITHWYTVTFIRSESSFLPAWCISSKAQSSNYQDN